MTDLRCPVTAPVPPSHRQTHHVRGSNHCLIGVFEDRIPGRAIVLAGKHSCTSEPMNLLAACRLHLWQEDLHSPLGFCGERTYIPAPQFPRSPSCTRTTAALPPTTPPLLPSSYCSD